jgi:hypothetical protein
MKPLVNLAGEPFRNRRLFWLSLLLVVVISALGGMRALRTLSEIDAQLTADGPRVQALEAKVRELEPSQSSSQALPAEQIRAYWNANGLIARKAFSWTQLLNDIERNIPSRVRVLRIGVSKNAAQDRANSAEPERRTIPLTMDVVARSVDDVTEMITAFNRTGIFIANPKWQKPVEGLADIEFGLEIEYRSPVTAHPVVAPAQQIAERK